MKARVSQTPAVVTGATTAKLERTGNVRWLKSGTWYQDADSVTVCFDLPKGRSTVAI